MIKLLASLLLLAVPAFAGPLDEPRMPLEPKSGADCDAYEGKLNAWSKAYEKMLSGNYDRAKSRAAAAGCDTTPPPDDAKTYEPPASTPKSCRAPVGDFWNLAGLWRQFSRDRDALVNRQYMACVARLPQPQGSDQMLGLDCNGLRSLYDREVKLADSVCASISIGILNPYTIPGSSAQCAASKKLQAGSKARMKSMDCPNAP